MSPLVMMHHDPFPVETAFAEPTGALPKHPSSAFLPLPWCRAQLLLLLLPANVRAFATGSSLGHQMPLPLAHRHAKLCSLLPIACSNPHPMAPGIFGDLSPLLLQVIPLLPCRTSLCSHWSFTADVKESKPRPLIVFVGGNLVIAFQILLTPSVCVGAGASLGGLGGRREGPASVGPAQAAGPGWEAPSGVFGFGLNPVNPSKMESVKEKIPK